MSQKTLVLKVTPAQAAALERRLSEGLPPDAEWRPVPHARFAVKALGVVLTCYTSGKVVVQGQSLESFAGRFLGGLANASPKRTARDGDAELPFDAVTIGSDEAGKGDYFGPLVVASVHARPGDADWLVELGVTDSKAVSDDRARRLAGQIEARLDHAVVRLPPAEYNRRHDATRNVNVVLGELHAEAIATLLGRHEDVEVVIVDRFAAERAVADPLRGRVTVLPRIVQVPRAERHPVVAAASIVARAAFLDGLAECSDACGTDLHKGAGAPTDAPARRVLEIGGVDLLRKVAKLHFKNTARARRS